MCSWMWIEYFMTHCFFLSRLFESHKKLQRVNHNLEDKLLKVVSSNFLFSMNCQLDSL